MKALALAAGLMSAAAFVAVFFVLLASRDPAQIKAVKAFDQSSELARIACLDVNGDGRVDAADADPQRLPDITGDHKVDNLDLSVVRAINFVLPQGKPKDCNNHQPTDWQVGPPAQIDCAAGRGGFIVFGVGGGAVDLSTDTDAAGVRWMLVEVGKILEGHGVPYQLISMAPGLNGTGQPQPDSETWAATYLTQQLDQTPCLRVIFIGHSHGGTTVTATASRLEEAGLADQVALSALVDRVTGLYAGDARSVPQTSRVFNIFLAIGEQYEGKAIDQPNVENFNASGLLAPENGEQGGPLKPATHTTIDNSTAALDEIIVRILALPALQR